MTHPFSPPLHRPVEVAGAVAAFVVARRVGEPILKLIGAMALATGVIIRIVRIMKGEGE